MIFGFYRPSRSRRALRERSDSASRRAGGVKNERAERCRHAQPVQVDRRRVTWISSNMSAAACMPFSFDRRPAGARRQARANNCVQIGIDTGGWEELRRQWSHTEVRMLTPTISTDTPCGVPYFAALRASPVALGVRTLLLRQIAEDWHLGQVAGATFTDDVAEIALTSFIGPPGCALLRAGGRGGRRAQEAVGEAPSIRRRDSIDAK
jgi:hypothetical protein